MEVRNELCGVVAMPTKLSERQRRIAIADIMTHTQVTHIKLVGSELAVLVNVGALTGTVAQNSLGLVLAYAQRKLDNAATARKLDRHQLARV